MAIAARTALVFGWCWDTNSTKRSIETLLLVAQKAVDELGWHKNTARVVGALRLLFWHLLQPLMYFWIFFSFSDQIRYRSELQYRLGLAVAASVLPVLVPFWLGAGLALAATVGLDGFRLARLPWPTVERRVQQALSLGEWQEVTLTLVGSLRRPRGRARSVEDLR